MKAFQDLLGAYVSMLLYTCVPIKDVKEIRPFTEKIICLDGCLPALASIRSEISKRKDSFFAHYVLSAKTILDACENLVRLEIIRACTDARIQLHKIIETGALPASSGKENKPSESTHDEPDELQQLLDAFQEVRETTLSPHTTYKYLEKRVQDLRDILNKLVEKDNASPKLPVDDIAYVTCLVQSLTE